MAEYILVHGIRIAKDFTPETFGRLTTLGSAFMVGRRSFQVCLCVCGDVRIVQTSALKRSVRSCGCLRSEMTSNRRRTHGKSRTVEYEAWKNMRKRCYNPQATQYKDWGGRGIKVCVRWQVFEAFLEDVGPRPSPQHSIDRIDVDGDYCPENCRWATRREQANNMRHNRRLSAFGRTQTLSQWATEIGIPDYCVRLRIDRYNWSVERSLSTPLKGNTPKGPANGSK